MFRFRRGISALLIIASMVMVVSPLSYAATATPSKPGGSGYRISPVRTDPLTDPGLVIPAGGSHTVRVYVTNVSSTPQDVKVLLNDFRSDNENGQPALYLNGEAAPRNSLKRYMTPSATPFTLAPGEQKSIDIKITMPTTAKPGGYFGAVRFAPAGIAGNDNVNVNLAASVASLILVTVPGNYKEQVSIASFGTAQDGKSGSFFTSPKNLQAVVRFQNGGDVQEQPFGKVILKKGSKILDTYEINNTTPRGNLLPDSIRRFSVDLHKIGSFGKYTVEGNFGYGSKGQLLSATSTFYVVPVALIALGLFLVLLILFLIFGLPRLLRNYKRKVIRESRGRR